LGNKKNNKSIYIIISIAVIILIAVVATVKIISLNKTTTKKASLETYSISSNKKVFIDGVISPDRKESIYYDITSGDIDKVNVKAGDSVDEGAVLFTYKNSEITNQITSLKEQIKKLQKDKSNAKNSANLPVQDTSTVDSINSQIDSVNDQIKDLQAREYKDVKAPCSGIVYLNSPNDKTGKPYIIIQSKTYHIDGTISEKDYSKVNVNDVVNITILSNNVQLKGKIASKESNPSEAVAATALGTTTTSQLSSYPVKITPDNTDGLINGFHVQCILILSNTEIKIPLSAIKTVDNKKIVFKVENKKAKKVEVEISKEESGNAVIKSGLTGGEKIIKSPADTMKEGDDVE
jgi:Membrane-fusion protein